MANIGGNHYDKYNTRNPLARALMNGFLAAFDELAAHTGARSCFEVGCGEGELSLRLAQRGVAIAGCDVEADTVAEANSRAAGRGHEPAPFATRSLFELDPAEIDTDLVVCCEVLEHVEAPERAVEILASLNARHVLVSVPREPIWRALNMARGKYLGSFGNTPGHIQHWGKAGFLRLLKRRFDIVAVRSPLPWSMALCARQCRGS